MAKKHPPQTAEGRLIEEATKASGRSVRGIAANVGISDTRLRHLVRGWQPGPNGEPIASHAPARTLARIAVVLGISPEALTEAGRQDAADLIPAVIEQRSKGLAGLIPPPPTVQGRATLTSVSGLTVGPGIEAHPGGHPIPDEIDLIMASQTMSAREKLLRIRQVLELRSQVEAELQEMVEAGAQEPKEAPAGEAETSEEDLPEVRPS